MPENNFEKKVQQLMDEVKLRPSEEVWVQVEKRIGEKKRRRLLFFLLPIMAGLLLVGGYYFLMKDGSNEFKTSLNQKSPQPEKYPAPGKQTKNTSSPTALSTGEIKTGNTVSLPPQYAEKLSSRKKDLNKKSLRNKQGTAASSNNRKNKNQTAKPLFADDDNDLITNAATVIAQGTTTGNAVVKNAERIETIIPDATTAQEVFKKNDSSTSAATTNNTASNTGINNKDSVANAITKPIVIASQKKWRWGFHAAIGASGSTSKGIPGFSENKSADISYGSPGSVTSSPNRIITYPSQATPALSFELGLLAQKALSKKLTFTTGLQYHFASDRINAGKRFDSTIQLQNFSSNRSYNNYYSRNNATYTNRYHFIEWPVGISWQINKGKHLPVSWHNGIVIGLLAKTNGLVYDTAARGIYYQDKTMFSKILLNAATGFSFHFNQQKKWQWSLGPDIRFGLNRLRKAEQDRNKYLVAGAVHVNVLFPQ